MTVRRRIHQAVPAFAAAAQPRLICLCTAFVDEAETPGIYVTCFLSPRATLTDDLRPILLRGPKRLFFLRVPKRFSVLNTVTTLHGTPLRSASSASVASGCSALWRSTRWADATENRGRGPRLPYSVA
jgi:hypothetical protein